MESLEAEIVLIAYIGDGWHLIEAKSLSIMQGPYDTHEDACEAARTRAYRRRQGWAS